jgi:hypothetical protein
MGQYFKMVNLDKKEYLHPHKFGEGMKLFEFGCGGSGLMAGLNLLLSSGNGDESLEGRWAGDRIVCIGDYAEENRFVPGSLYSLATEESDTGWRDISFDVLRALCKHTWFKNEIMKRFERYKHLDRPSWLN